MVVIIQNSNPGSDAAYYCTYVERDIEIYSNLHSCDMNTSTHIVTEISRTSQK